MKVSGSHASIMRMCLEAALNAGAIAGEVGAGVSLPQATSRIEAAAWAAMRRNGRMAELLFWMRTAR